MKAIINGKTYNTETATEIGHYSRFGYTDFRYIDEGLFRTKKRELFSCRGRWTYDTLQSPL